MQFLSKVANRTEGINTNTHGNTTLKKYFRNDK